LERLGCEGENPQRVVVQNDDDDIDDDDDDATDMTIMQISVQCNKNNSAKKNYYQRT
jgi:hypothetical protein